MDRVYLRASSPFEIILYLLHLKKESDSGKMKFLVAVLGICALQIAGVIGLICDPCEEELWDAYCHTFSPVAYLTRCNKTSNGNGYYYTYNYAYYQNNIGSPSKPCCNTFCNNLGTSFSMSKTERGLWCACGFFYNGVRYYYPFSNYIGN